MEWSHSDIGQRIYRATSRASRCLLLLLLLFPSLKDPALRSIFNTITVKMTEAEFLVE